MNPKNNSHSKKINIKKYFTFIWIKVTNHKLLSVILLIVIIFVSLIIWTFSSINNFIVGGGSTSVNDVMVDATNAYQNQTGQDILYNSLGSAAALVGVKNGSYDFGFMSEDVPDQNGINNVDAVDLWTNNKINRFVIAQDYIMLVYHLPNGCTINNNKKYLNFTIPKNSNTNNTIDEIYLQHKTWQSVFSGQLTCSSQNTPFFTITRESGSGTREFFESNIIKTKNYDTNQVATSNGDMLQAIENTPNSIGYLSFSFLDNVINSKLTISAIGAVGNELPYNNKNNTYDFNPNYKEVRPFTGIIENPKKNSALNFISWLLDPIPYYIYQIINKSYPSKIPAFLKNPIWTSSAAYWYIKNGEKPLSILDNKTGVFSSSSIYNQYNNNTDYLISLIPKNSPNRDYQSIYNLISLILLNKYEKYKVDPIFNVIKSTLNKLSTESYPKINK